MSSPVNQLNYEANGIEGVLCSIESRLAFLQNQVIPKESSLITPLQRAKEYYLKRRARDRMFGNKNLFSDPAWDILIDLFIAFEEGRGISVSSACLASAVPMSTALRCVNNLEGAGHISRYADPHDARRVFISLTHTSATAVREFFSD